MLPQTENKLIKILFDKSGITPEKANQTLEEVLAQIARSFILFWEIKDIEKATTFKK